MKIGPLEIACNFPDWLLTPGEHRLTNRDGCGDLRGPCVYVSMCVCVREWQLHSRSSCTQPHTPHLSPGCPGWLMDSPFPPALHKAQTNALDQSRASRGYSSGTWPEYFPCMWMERDFDQRAKVDCQRLIMGQWEPRQV